MRVAYVCADLGVPVMGMKGCSIHVQEILQQFLRRGDQVDLYAARQGGAVLDCLQGIRVVDWKRDRSRDGEDRQDTGQREIKACDWARRISQAVVEEGPYDLIYERYSLWSRDVVDHAASSGTPMILEVNAPLVQEQLQHRELVHRDLALEIAKSAFEKAQSVVAVSEAVADHVRQVASSSRVTVIPNGVALQRFGQSNRQWNLGDAFHVGFVGTLKPWHGVEMLLEAVARLRQTHPEVTLSVVGDGPLGDRLRTISQSDPRLAGGVTFSGKISPQQVPEWLQRWDVGVAPYPAMEPFYFSPLKVLEYMASGLPVLASRIGQLEQWVQDRQTGLLVDPGSVDALQEGLQWMMAHRREIWRMGQAGRRQAERSYGWDRVLQRSLDTVDLSGSELQMVSP